MIATNYTTPIVSRWDQTSASGYNAIGFVFAVRVDGNNIIRPRMTMAPASADPNGSVTNSCTTLSLVTNRDYYLAATYNSGTVTFYLVDLSVAVPQLQIEVASGFPSAVANTPATLRVGAHQIPAGFNVFPGLIDEARYSRVALSPQRLLFTEPLPVVPANLTAVASNTAVVLTWTASTNATSYRVKRSPVNGGPYTNIASPTGTSFVDVNAVVGATNYYVVSAVSVWGESSNSSQASAMPVNQAPQPTILPVYWDSTGTNLLIRTATVAGHNYVLQSTPGLESPVVWTPVVTNSGTGGTITNSLPVTVTDSKRFFRYSVQ